MDDGKRLWLIDWEYGGFGTAMFDLANIASNNQFDEKAEQDLLAAYFERESDGALLRSFYAMKSRGSKNLDEDQLTRISLLVGIYKALNILYSPKLANAWMKLPNANSMFGGDSPLNYIRRGGIPALLRIRQLLDARRGGR